MIKFKYLSTSDKEIIQSFTIWGERQNCDYSFANLIGWRFLYNTEFAIIDSYLVFRFYNGHHLTYQLPLRKPVQQADGTYMEEPCDDCFINVINAIRQDSIAMGHPFIMLGASNKSVELLEQAFPDTFNIKPNPDYMDYIYTREKLINLSGKHLQSKRNHINKFKNLYPSYQYRDLTPDIIPECLMLEKQWRRNREEENFSESRVYEQRSMTRIFNRWDKLDTIGGTIWIDNKLIAFTFGCPINHNTFDVCVEKADNDYEGSFSIINQEFVKHLPEQYTYINREEDMGEEGLRKAKQSYKPDILLDKCAVMEKHPLADFEDQDRILKETKSLWQTVFNDSPEFVNLYFSRVYKSEYNITCQINHHVAAALQTLPYTLLYHKRELPVAYISGVSVSPDYRKQGIGDAIMRQAHFNSYCKGAVFAILIPAEDWLNDWYSKCGYTQNIMCTPPQEDISDMPFARFDAWQRQKSCIVMHDAEGFDVIKEDIKLAGDKYKPATKSVQGMVRVINAKKALELYAAQNPNIQRKLRLQADHDIPMNNAYYIINKGTAERTEEPLEGAEIININQLSDLFFAAESAEMNLMLN